MKKFFISFVASFLLSFGVSAQAAEKATKEEAITMVKNAIAYIKANGRDKAFAEINNPKGKFVDRDLYVMVYDMNGKNLAHGGNPKMIGKDLIEMKDVDGVPMIKNRIELAKEKGKGWQDYKFVNPVTKEIEPKTVYIEKLDDIVLACGVYR